MYNMNFIISYCYNKNSFLVSLSIFCRIIAFDMFRVLLVRVGDKTLRVLTLSYTYVRIVAVVDDSDIL